MWTGCWSSCVARGKRRSRDNVTNGVRRYRIAGAGRHHELEFTDRVLVTLAVLRLQIPHAPLALMFEVDRSTITRAVHQVHQVRPLLAHRGFATPEGHRLRTLADVFAYADHHKVALRVDGSEIGVRRPRAITARTSGFRFGQEETEHAQDHRDHWAPGPHFVGASEVSGV